MKFTLLAKSYRKNKEPWLRPLTWTLISICILSLGLNILLQWQLEKEKVFYTDQVYPRLQAVSTYNERVATWEKLLQEKGQEIYFSWPVFLVALAETKPQEITLQEIRGEEKKALLLGQARDAAAVRTWQSQLTKRLGPATIGKLQRQEKGFFAFSLEVAYAAKNSL